MTTATVARTEQQRGPIRALTLVLVFGIGLAVGLALPLNRSAAQVAPASATTAQSPSVADPAAPASGTAVAPAGAESAAAWTAAMRNYAAAVARHDPPMAARFRQQINALTTPAVVADVYARYQNLLASIATANAQHDFRLRLAFRAQLTALCAAPGFLASFPGCSPIAN